MKKITFLLLLAYIAVNAVQAQSPNLFKYQAVLRDASGNIMANSPQTIVVNILQGSSTGTSVYQETHNVTSTAQGILNLNIGGGTVNSGVFANINWGTASFWVKLSIGSLVISNGQLLSVPYALNASTASSSQWLNGAGGIISYSGGNVGIGTTSPQNKLHVAGFVQLEGNPDAQVCFGTTGTNGKRGIGSLAGWDATKLYINGWGDFTGGVSIGKWGGTVETSDLYVNGNYNWAGAKNFVLTAPYTIANDFTFDFSNTDGNGLWGVYANGFVLSVRNNGRVGINTNNPSKSLDVNGTVRIADGTQGANKVLTSDANGNCSWVTNTGTTAAIVATLGSSSYNLTNTAGQYTGSYITLGPGKWSVQVNMLMADDASSLWIRSGFSTSSSSYNQSPYIVGAYYASGYKHAGCYGTLIGTIIVNNTSGSNITLYYWTQNIVVYSGSLSLSNFGTSLWGEDQMIAYPMN